MVVKMAVVKNLVAVKGRQVAVNFGEGGSEGLPRSGYTGLYAHAQLCCTLGLYHSFLR